MAELETWQNVSAGMIYVWETDKRGNMKDKIVYGGQKFQISTEDRIFNQDRATSSTVDLFHNGRCVPVRILEGTEGYEEIASNPNMISTSEMTTLLKGKVATVKAKLKDITNEVTLKRLLDVANESDVSISTLKAIQDRISQVREIAPLEISERISTSVPVGEDVHSNDGMKPVAV